MSRVARWFHVVGGGVFAASWLTALVWDGDPAGAPAVAAVAGCGLVLAGGAADMIARARAAPRG